MKLNGRKLLIAAGTIVLFLAGIRYNIQLDIEEEGKSHVTFEAVSNQFYYEQLTNEEKKICRKLEESLKKCEGGYIEFEQPISHYSFSRIIQTLMYDETHRNWSFVNAFPINKEGQILSVDFLNLENEDEERNVAGTFLYVDDVSGINNIGLFSMQLTDEGKIRDAQEFDIWLRSRNFTQEDFQKISEEIKDAERDIINILPDHVTEKRAVKLLTQWMKDHMVYGYGNQNRNSDKIWDIEQSVEYMRLSSEYSICERKAVCGGFATVLSKLCNLIGIESHVVLGKVENKQGSEYHAWVAVKMDHSIYYTDPTYAVVMGAPCWLRSSEELSQKGVEGNRYVALKYFQY